MVFASEPLAVLDLHHLPGPWMERIEDPHLERRTPGIVTLVRPAPAKVGLPVRSATRPAATITPFSIIDRGERGAGQRLALQDREPALDLVQPRYRRPRLFPVSRVLFGMGSPARSAPGSRDGSHPNQTLSGVPCEPMGVIFQSVFTHCTTSLRCVGSSAYGDGARSIG